jgi:hypothetical protein
MQEAIDFSGAPGEIRTPDPQIRSLVLYSPTSITISSLEISCAA